MNAPPLYRRHRFPSEVISHCVWLYFRFSISYRDVEEMMAARGLTLTYETIRYSCLKFGQTYANGLRRVDRGRVIGGIWTRRAVDQDGEVLDILVQSRRDKKAAKKFFRKLLKGLRYVPRGIITGTLRSYTAARADVMASVEHIQQKYQNNRAENSHQPTRLRERVMRQFKSAGHAALSLGVRDHHVTLPRFIERRRCELPISSGTHADESPAACMS